MHKVLKCFIPISSQKNVFVIKEGELVENIIFIKEGKLALEVAIDLNDPSTSALNIFKKNLKTFLKKKMILEKNWI